MIEPRGQAAMAIASVAVTLAVFGFPLLSVLCSLCAIWVGFPPNGPGPSLAETLRNTRHRMAHRLGWNLCRHWAEFSADKALLRWGWRCEDCGEVTVVRDCHPGVRTDARIFGTMETYRE